MSMSPIDHKKAGAGYLAATQRNRCGNCNNAAETSPGFWSCRPHGFLVTVYAVCNHWTRKVPHGFKTPPA